MKQRIDNNLFRNAYVVMMEDETVFQPASLDVNENIFEPATPEEQDERLFDYYVKHKDEMWDEVGEFRRHRRLSKATKRFFNDTDLIFHTDKLKITPRFLSALKTSPDHGPSLNFNVYENTDLDGYKIKVFMSYAYESYGNIWTNKPFDIEFVKKYF